MGSIRIPYSVHHIRIFKSLKFFVALTEEAMSVFKMVAGKLKGKRPPGKPRIDGRTVPLQILKNLCQYEELV